VAQGVGPAFKPQHHKKTKTKIKKGEGRLDIGLRGLQILWSFVLLSGGFLKHNKVYSFNHSLHLIPTY
jgi:hypothetical protein